MQQWEYCRILWSVCHGSQQERQEFEAPRLNATITELEDGRVAIMHGLLRHLGVGEDRVITNVHEEIAQLGLDGWEMVSHTEITTPTPIQIFYFKRPKM